MSDIDPARRRQWLVIGGVFAAVVALLGMGYYLFLSRSYTVLADHVRPGEAAAIVAELDKRGTAYELKDGGTTVLVPAAEADATRLALVRSDAAVAGQIGFELFNKSDMGLTNFAQKINYQRALQGELVRTITLMDGVDTARVHLALPERALFRDDRTEPSAAVTVQMRGATVPDAAMVAGIQRLVAAAVPDLSAERVVVLDAEGRVVSQSGSSAPTAADRSVESEARAAVEHYYRARARAAAEAARPGLRHQLRVVALPQADGVVDPSHWIPGGSAETRNFRLRMTLVTPAPLDTTEQETLAAAIRSGAGLDDDAGDVLLFETGPMVAEVSPPIAGAVPAPVRRMAASTTSTPKLDGAAWWPWWLWAAAAIVALVVAARLRGRDRRRLSAEDHEAFAQTLRRQLSLTDEVRHAAH